MAVLSKSTMVCREKRWREAAPARAEDINREFGLSIEEETMRERRTRSR
jgi:hypothetical protein